MTINVKSCKSDYNYLRQGFTHLITQSLTGTHRTTAIFREQDVLWFTISTWTLHSLLTGPLRILCNKDDVNS